VETTDHDETVRWFHEEWHWAEELLGRGRQMVGKKLRRRNDAGDVDSILLSGMREGIFSTQEHSYTRNLLAGA
jgi:hypothetical protein